MELCGAELSKSRVSALCSRLDPLGTGWNERPLTGPLSPFLVVDALGLKIREDGRGRARSALIATGITATGHRELLGLPIGDSESEASWGALCQSLKSRGLRGVDLVVSAQHGGLVEAVKMHFQGASWHRCPAPFSRHVVCAAPKAVQKELKTHRRALRTAPDLATARRLLKATLAHFEERAPQAIAVLAAGFDDATAVLALPAPYRIRLRTPNSQERLNEEIRRRERVIRLFPNREAALRLLGALLMEWDEQ